MTHHIAQWGEVTVFLLCLLVVQAQAMTLGWMLCEWWRGWRG